MTKRKVLHRRLVPRVTRQPMLRGTILAAPLMVAQRYSDRLTRLIDRMIDETLRDVASLSAAFDDNVGPQARILTNALRAKFDDLFASIAKPAAEQMTDSVDDEASAKTETSLKKMSEQIAFKTDSINVDVLSATVAENVALIKRIPSTYFDDVTGAVMRSIQGGSDLAGLKSQLDTYGVKVRNWTHNTCLDQVRKAFNGMAAAKMQGLGIEEFEWIHSGGSDHPRVYHRDVLDGEIFKFDDPPHLVGPGEGEKGLPGRLPYCRCKMKPVFRFSKDDE